MGKAFEMIKAGLEDALAHARGQTETSKIRAHIPAEGDSRSDSFRPEHDRTKD